MRTKPFNTRSARRARQEWVALLSDMMEFGARMERAYDKLKSTHGDGYVRGAIDSVEVEQLIEKFYVIEQYSASFFADTSPRVAHAIRDAITTAVNEDAAKLKPATAS